MYNRSRDPVTTAEFGAVAAEIGGRGRIRPMAVQRSAMLEAREVNVGCPREKRSG